MEVEKSFRMVEKHLKFNFSSRLEPSPARYSLRMLARPVICSMSAAAAAAAASRKLDQLV